MSRYTSTSDSIEPSVPTTGYTRVIEPAIRTGGVVQDDSLAAPAVREDRARGAVVAELVTPPQRLVAGFADDRLERDAGKRDRDRVCELNLEVAAERQLRVGAVGVELLDAVSLDAQTLEIPEPA